MEALSSAPMPKEGYTSWAAIAGYFDGDGSVDVDLREYTLHWVLSFSDNWPDQIEQVRNFLISRDISVGKPRKAGGGGWMCEVAEISSMKRMATEMLASGGIFKKKRELQLLLDYYSGKITGTDVIKALNSEVRAGIRVGKIRNAEMPYTYGQGYSRGRYASRYEQRALSSSESAGLIAEYLSSNVTGKSLARKYDVSEATISRLLKREGIETKSRRRNPTSSSVENEVS